MKQLTCEMCGSTDLLKQEGVFVCQSCGTKYSVEEAKKMMVEGTVEVTGTVKVDTTSKLSNLYEIARRARNDNNTEKAAQYYDMILREDPMSWEASFYTTYYSAMQTNIAGIRSAAIKVSNCIDTVLKLIKNNVPEEKQYFAVFEVESKAVVIASILCNAAENHYNGIDSEIRGNYQQECIDRLHAVSDLMYNTGNQIEKIMGGEKYGATIAEAWKTGIIIHKKILGLLIFRRESDNKVIDSYSQKIGRYDPEYLKQHNKEAVPARIRDIDLQVKKTEKGMKGTRKATAFLSFAAAAATLLELFARSDSFLHPIALAAPVLLIVCGAVLWKGMTRPELWRKGLGIAAVAWFLFRIVPMGASGIIYSFGWMGNWATLMLLPVGIILLLQKFDPAKIEAGKNKIADLEKEKAELEKRLADLG